MAAQYSAARRNSSSNTQLLDELEVLSQSLYQSHAPAARRTASLALPRSSLPQLISSAPPASADDPKNDLYNQNINPKPRTRRLSLSPWRSRSNDQPKQQPPPPPSTTTNTNKFQDDPSSSDKKSGGLWKWKPIRALSHIAKQKMSCLFSVEVVSVQGLPTSMNGLRLSVCVRKKETKDGAVHTMPSRVSQGVADFEETLFIRCHVYCSPTGPGNALPKFEPRPFLIYVFAVDAHELDFGRSSVDLSRMIEESVQKNSEGTRVRQWDTSFNLSGKAKGGELVLKLGFQLMEKDGGIGIYSQSEEQKSVKPKNYSSSSARQQSKASFSIPSPRLSSRPEASWTPSNTGTSADLQGIDDLNLDDPAPEPETIVQKPEEQEMSNIEEVDFLDFDVEEKGVEFQEKAAAAAGAADSATDNEAQSEDNSDKRSVSSEVVKEVLQDQLHLNRLSELDSIAQQIKALESMMGDEKSLKLEDVEEPAQRLEADEETVTREFLQMLEDEDDDRGFLQIDDHSPSLKKLHQYSGDGEGKVYLPDLGKGLGCVVQTKDGGYLSALNPLDIEMDRKDSPKLAIQTSKPLVVSSIGGFELFQRIAGLGFESLSSEIASLMPMDEITGKTAEQVAFEGLASAIIDGRSKEGASSTAARTIVAVKTMATAMNIGRSERISTGLWNVGEEPISIEEILAFSMQKIEAMTVEALKIQAEMSEEEAPFDVSPLKDNQALASAVPLEKWMTSNSSSSTVTITVITQLRDPMRRYEAVGGPMIAFINAARVNDDGDKRFKIASLHVGGMKVKSRGGGGGGKRSSWDSEKQRLTSMQWLVAYGLGKRGKSGAGGSISKGQDLFWSLSSRVVADMWLKHIRNPDVKIINN
ncbi:protein PLASTID MOVEMENT IMPAIRED 1-like [Impatiens glandulifera]|uniref:protein PLASTID MOVEMENT IMPAIRED 1-like n=1 Tax=Impatiens glandulifera TaxID=253017 RepID=UPI001FB17E87|nr:protein PLASTID MOVEMENT IMPAIRED 1-like [Impatiens glandulifera]